MRLEPDIDSRFRFWSESYRHTALFMQFFVHPRYWRFADDSKKLSDVSEIDSISISLTVAGNYDINLLDKYYNVDYLYNKGLMPCSEFPKTRQLAYERNCVIDSADFTSSIDTWRSSQVPPSNINCKVITDRVFP